MNKMTRQYAIDSLGYGMFANNSELIHEIFDYFENEVKILDTAIKIYEGALKSSSERSVCTLCTHMHNCSNFDCKYMDEKRKIPNYSGFSDCFELKNK